MVVTLPVSVVVPPALVVTEVSAVVPPTTPLKVVAPVVFTARVCPPFTVEAKEIAALPVLVHVVAPVSVTASLYVCVPAVEMLPVSWVVPPFPLVRLLIPVNVAPSIVVVPEKFSWRLDPGDVTPPENVGVAPVRFVNPPSVTALL